MPRTPRHGLRRQLSAWVGLLVGMLCWAPVPLVADGERDGVRWTAGAQVEGERLADRWPAIVEEVQERLGLRVSLEGTELVVVRGHDELERQARVSVPTWAAAVTVGGRRIVVRADAPGAVRSTLEETLRHEAVHLVWARYAGLRAHKLPRWFEEGLAEEVGGGISVSAGARLEVAVARDRLHDFAQLERSFPADAEGADLAYQQARRWVMYLVGRAGWTEVRRLLREVPRGSPDETPSAALSRALREVTLHDLSEWHGDWLSSLDERRSRWWLWFLTDLGGVLLALLALLSALGFAALRRRRREQIARLPDDSPTPPGPADDGAAGTSPLGRPEGEGPTTGGP